MSDRRRRLAALALVPALLLLGAVLPRRAAARPTDLRPTAPSTVTVALSALPEGVDPLTTDDQYSRDIEALLYDPLYYVTPDMAYAPDLAESWQVGRGGRTYTYSLDPRARWTDGQPVTATDVVASLRAYASQADTGPLRSGFSDLLRVEAIGTERVQVTLRVPDPDWPGVLAGLAILPARALVRGQRATPLVGGPTDGPYALRRWDGAGGLIVLGANASYFRGAPHVARIVLRVIPDATQALADVRRGAVQVAALPPDLAGVAARLADVEVHEVAGDSVTMIALNVRSGPLARLAVRRALALAVDRPALLAALHEPGPVPAGPWPASFPTSAATALPYDPAEARRLLGEAGFAPAAGDGVRQPGRLLSLSLSYPSDATSLAQAAAVVARDWRAVGVRVRLSAEPVPVFEADLRRGRFEAAATTAVFGDGASLVNLVDGADVAGYANGRARALLARDGQTLDRAVPPAPTLVALAALLDQGSPYLPLWAGRSVVVTSPTLAGFAVSPAGPDIYQPQRWILP